MKISSLFLMERDIIAADVRHHRRRRHFSIHQAHETTTTTTNQLKSNNLYLKFTFNLN